MGGVRLGGLRREARHRDAAALHPRAGRVHERDVEHVRHAHDPRVLYRVGGTAPLLQRGMPRSPNPHAGRRPLRRSVPPTVLSIALLSVDFAASSPLRPPLHGAAGADFPEHVHGRGELLLHALLLPHRLLRPHLRFWSHYRNGAHRCRGNGTMQGGRGDLRNVHARVVVHPHGAPILRRVLARSDDQLRQHLLDRCGFRHFQPRPLQPAYRAHVLDV
mmetsp:Transcript_54428/g.129316  ORF Transcript_54428/g.129316 Transcript_54428/m.129316 type:complete len:218 (+) Transcript_54428:384-1037(+)